MVPMGPTGPMGPMGTLATLRPVGIRRPMGPSMQKNRLGGMEVRYQTVWGLIFVLIFTFDAFFENVVSPEIWQRSPPKLIKISKCLVIIDCQMASPISTCKFMAAEHPR